MAASGAFSQAMALAKMPSLLPTLQHMAVPDDVTEALMVFARDEGAINHAVGRAGIGRQHLLPCVDTYIRKVLLHEKADPLRVLGLRDDNDKKRMLFIDEAHKLLVDQEVAIFYRELVKQARKRNVGVVSITQDVEDFLNNEYGKAIITNSETKVLLKQSYAALSEIGSIYPMTDEEKQQLGHLGIGEVILFREGEHIRLNILVLPFEKPLTFTNQ